MLEDIPNYQGNAVVKTYTSLNELLYYRVIEHKHFDNVSVWRSNANCPMDRGIGGSLLPEYSGKSGTVFIQLNDDCNNALADKYRRLADTGSWW